MSSYLRLMANCSMIRSSPQNTLICAQPRCQEQADTGANNRRSARIRRAGPAELIPLRDRRHGCTWGRRHQAGALRSLPSDGLLPGPPLTARAASAAGRRCRLVREPRARTRADARPASECSSRADRLTTSGCRAVAAAAVDNAVPDALTPEQVAPAAKPAGPSAPPARRNGEPARPGSPLGSQAHRSRRGRGGPPRSAHVTSARCPAVPDRLGLCQCAN